MAPCPGDRSGRLSQLGCTRRASLASRAVAAVPTGACMIGTSKPNAPTTRTYQARPATSARPEQTTVWTRPALPRDGPLRRQEQHGGLPDALLRPSTSNNVADRSVASQSTKAERRALSAIRLGTAGTPPSGRRP